eukprot:COSAG05_NODE_78_length_21399_cov_26.298216_6_plen_58_part_00
MAVEILKKLTEKFLSAVIVRFEFLRKRSRQSLAAALSIFHRQVCFLLATAHFLRQNG